MHVILLNGVIYIFFSLFFSLYLSKAVSWSQGKSIFRIFCHFVCLRFICVCVFVCLLRLTKRNYFQVTKYVHLCIFTFHLQCVSFTDFQLNIFMHSFFCFHLFFEFQLLISKNFYKYMYVCLFDK